MKKRAALTPLLTLVIAGCVTMPPSGAPVTLVVPSMLPNTVAFDHGCALESVRIIRADASDLSMTRTVDLDVCGTVRRYKLFKDTWVDVTSLYPPSTLPAPLSASPADAK